MTRVVVAVAWCTPGRQQVQTMLRPYGFSATVHGETLVKTLDGSPAYFRVAVDFTPQAAKWGEYVLLRSGALLLSRPLDRRNEGWALRHDGPPRPWHQAGCKAPSRTKAQHGERAQQDWRALARRLL